MKENLKIIKRPSKDERYIAIAKEVAKGSTCLRAMVGAIIVKDDVVVSMGYVGSPRGEPNCCDTGICERSRLNIPAGQNYELCKSLHAEANAVINAARTGGSGILGGKMYLYVERLDGQKKFHRGMCVMCVRILKNAGIKTVLYKEVAGEESISDMILL